VLLGIVGEGASIEFSGYCENAISEERILKILEDPEKASFPRKLGDQYALISYVTSRSNEKSIRDAAAVLLSRLKPELAILLLRNILQRSPRFVSHAQVKEFMSENRDLVL
jgi:HEAT repeat protein